jgi:hypothetical protein
MNPKFFLLSFAAFIAGSPAAHSTDNVTAPEIARKVPFLTLTAPQTAASKSAVDPFIDSAIPAPPKSEYRGTLFQLRHDYPSKLPPPQNFPWKKVIGNGPITPQNSIAYVDALKEYVAADVRRMLFHYDHWDAAKEPWWESIWIGTEREPIHGLYVGSGFPAGTLPQQKYDLTTYVLTLYDARSAVTLGNIWGTDLQGAMHPKLTNPGAQFAEGSVIVKFAFVTPCGSDWAPMKGAAVWKAYTTLNTSNGSGNHKTACPENGSKGSNTAPTLTNLYLMQFDIIVKDSQAAPQTGWVFSTLVYDKNAPGKDAWDKMIPLGATWGNDPDIINTSSEAITPPVKISTKLKQNHINPKAPIYATATLGWDGRLSGPNDGAVVTPAWAGGKYYQKGIASVGCLGCHSNAQYMQKSFLLPTTTYPPAALAPPLSSAASDVLVLNPPGSKAWMKWFQSRAGTEPMDPGLGQIGLDYDMVTAFKAIPMWQAATQPGQ